MQRCRDAEMQMQRYYIIYGCTDFRCIDLNHTFFSWAFVILAEKMLLLLIIIESHCRWLVSCTLWLCFPYFSSVALRAFQRSTPSSWGTLILFLSSPSTSLSLATSFYSFFYLQRSWNHDSLIVLATPRRSSLFAIQTNEHPALEAILCDARLSQSVWRYWARLYHYTVRHK